MKQNENEQLHDHVRELRDENGRLHKLLSEKDFEIKHLKKKREEERLALAGKQCTISIASGPKKLRLLHQNMYCTARGRLHEVKVYYYYFVIFLKEVKTHQGCIKKRL